MAQLAKNRVKISDFTGRDKSHLLDLFVNNEKTLLNIYEALFPHRATSGIGTFSQQAPGNQFTVGENGQLYQQAGMGEERGNGIGQRSSSHFGGASGANTATSGVLQSQQRYAGHA